MPTGYTASVAEGKVTDFREFALRCSRAFLYQMRDEPWDTPIPEEVEVYDYYSRRAQEAKDALVAFSVKSDEELEALQREAIEKAAEYREQYIKERREKRDRYALMLGKAIVYDAPTDKHKAYREYMIEQLTTSIDHDCGGSYLPEIPILVSAEEYYERKVEHLEREVEYTEEQYAKELERAAEGTAWLKALHGSLDNPILA